MTIPLALIYRNGPLYNIRILAVTSPELFNEQISTSGKKKKRGGENGCCKSTSVQGSCMKNVETGSHVLRFISRYNN